MGMMNTKKYYSFLAFAIVVLLSACGKDPQSPGRTYMPDMQYSQAYETYSENPNFKDGKTARQPVKGTIPQGTFPAQIKSGEDQEAYHLSYLHERYFDNTPEGYELAGKVLKNPLEPTDEVLEKGGEIFNTFCMVCHGSDGGGQGPIVQSGSFPIVPPYSFLLKDKPEGKMFHSITYGKNNMGSYASQVTPEERWMVIYYIQKLAGVGQFAEEPEATPQDTTNAGS